MVNDILARATLLIALTAPLNFLPGMAEADDRKVKIEQAWARASIGTSRPAAAYVSMTNNGDSTVTLTEVSTPVSGNAQVHKTEKQGDVMKMSLAGPIRIPPGESLEMRPGGLHIMIMDLAEPVREGNKLELTLHFLEGNPLTVSAPVTGPGAMGPE